MRSPHPLSVSISYRYNAFSVPVLTPINQLLGMVWQGKDAVKTGRKMLGETNPLNSAPGTIRGDFCLDVGKNICHGSDAVESAEKEIALWFPRGVKVSFCI